MTYSTVTGAALTDPTIIAIKAGVASADEVRVGRLASALIVTILILTEILF